MKKRFIGSYPDILSIPPQHLQQLQLEFEDDGKSKEFEVEGIRDSAVYARESEDGRPPGLYYLIH